ncbi:MULTISPECIES: PIN domain-containing protein [Allochromatium]|uniref:Ribonuclease VapC n=1 Tax=Allochromatium humboldtianum TaxID=504901 RepID=A0A850RDT7_9GAMM|nr:VapC toxin family PIN domain ribonuclease [Allochromatium vinosum]NVZ10396.1 type II toxin-antitoxin system VapC family toxin [Allochromatium humboldtianum]
MSYLIDTNALSELKKRQPNANVERWFADQPATSLYLSVLTLGELRKGIAAMPEGARKTSFSAWLDTEVPRYFSSRILDVGARVADRWGRLCAEAGRPLPAIDSLLAATALEHGLTLVTRNLDDFALPGVRVINPWQTGSTTPP